MRSFIAAAALVQSFVHLASAQTVNNDSTSACPQQGGVHIIDARGSLEPQGYGFIGLVKDSVLAQVPGSNAEFVVWEATLDRYLISATDGAVAARALIEAYVTNCPGLPLAVMGYSQGAQVLGDALVGQDDKVFPHNDSISDPLPASTLAQVAAVILMGDPTFNTTESQFHVGNATTESDFPRQNVGNFAIADLGSRTQSYCDDGDLFCASGNSIIIHAGYVKEYGTDAASYVVKQVAAWYAKNGGSSSGSSSTGVLPKPSASSRAATGTAARSMASASATLSSVPSSPSASTTLSASTTTSSTAVSTGAASSLQVAGAGMGAVVAGLFAFML